MNRTAIYPGSFDPFTNGHFDIVRKSAMLFDKVYIVIGINKSKKRTFDSEKMKVAIEHCLEDAGITNCKVCIYCGLVAEFANEVGSGYMIRGLRNNMDYFYEENIAEVNKLINRDLEYVYFRAENVAVSSSMVKELFDYGKNVERYVPTSVLTLMNEDGKNE